MDNCSMDWQRFEKDWNLYQRKAQHRWRRLEFAHWQAIGGKLHRLIDHIQVLYSLSRNLAEEEVQEWLETLDDEPLWMCG